MHLGEESRGGIMRDVGYRLHREIGSAIDALESLS